MWRDDEDIFFKSSLYTGKASSERSARSLSDKEAASARLVFHAGSDHTSTARKTLPKEFFAGMKNSSSSDDSDSSVGSEVCAAAAARAHFSPLAANRSTSSSRLAGGETGFAPRPKPRTSLDSRATPRSGSAFAAPSGSSALFSRDSDKPSRSTGSEEKCVVRPKTEEKCVVRPKTEEKCVVRPKTTTASTAGRPNPTTAKLPLSSDEHLSLKKYLGTTPNKASISGRQPEKPSFERHQAKMSDSSRGLEFSRLDTKASLSDFIPGKEIVERNKTTGDRASGVRSDSDYRKPNVSKEKQVGAMGGAPSRGAALATELDRTQLRLSSLRLANDDSLSEAAVAVSVSQTQRNVPSQSKSNPGRAQPQRKDSVSSDDTEDDVSLEAMLGGKSRGRFVPPRRYTSGEEQRRLSDHRREPRIDVAERNRRLDREDRNRRVNMGERNIPEEPVHAEGGVRRGPRDEPDRLDPRPGHEREGPRRDVRRDIEGQGRPVGRVVAPVPHREDDHRQQQQNEPQQRREYGGNGPGHNNNGNNRRPFNRPLRPDGLRPLEANLSFGRLRDLRDKQPAEVVAALTYSKEGMRQLLANDSKLTSDPQMMRLLLSALAKVSQCHSMPSQQSEILNVVRSSQFLKHLGTYLATTMMTSQVMELRDVIRESAQLLTRLVQLFPSEVHSVVMAHAFVDLAAKQASNRGGGALPDDVARSVKELETAKDAAMNSLQHKQIRGRGEVMIDEDSLTPPDDFRDISVFPTMADLNKDELPFLRKNKVKGGYQNVDHYLDVQFRLLREDFVYPLREGIHEYLELIANPRRGQKLKDIRVYHDVHILRPVCLTSGLGHRLTFDVSRMKRVRWEVSKRLIYGSLVCLSADNFTTLFFATVTNREPSMLKEGVVDVVFEHDLEQVSAIPTETTFTMAETTAFFEAYRHVLSGLQKIRGNDFPFQQYIITCNKTVAEPRYLTTDAAPKTYDMRPLVDDSVVLREDRQLQEQGREVPYSFSAKSRPAERVTVLYKEEWPDPELLQLDDSQYKALQSAFTKEFSVIQGPPGTGKTYVGLKIVKGLLHNRQCWDPNQTSCMLIVCYTNHALDQFLEGVLQFFKGKIVRVGSRCKSEKLEPYSLNNLRWSRRKQRDVVDRDFQAITRLRFQGHEAMDNLKREIDNMGLKIESAKREILQEDVLQPYMMDKHYCRLLDARPMLENQQGFQQQGRTKKKVFCIPEWLGIGLVLQDATADELLQLDMELGEDEVDIEGEIQALEEMNKLDVDVDNGDRRKRERERKLAQEEERRQILAVDISRLDRQGKEVQQQGQHGGFQIPRAHWRKIKRKLRRNVELDGRMTEQEEQQVEDLWELPFEARWRLYRRWTHGLCRALQTDMRQRERLYHEQARRQQETLMQEDKHILKTSTVIAMTTTAAARYQSVLQEIKPRVIVVEEAAEVLEGHVITTLSGDCQHLILIGDHKQLRPNPTVFALARKYNLELSLFERMINNGLKCDTLACQHRMRPEIARLVKPIYPTLQNHRSVENYENIKGVSKNLFFLSHMEPEQHDEETKSHSNIFEAQFMAQLCQYLLKQGYAPHRITVLTTYSGQLFQLKKLMPRKSIFEGVRVTVVDNFQGEENDIILLSLVRSNEDGKIGFLEIENRVCVALSRAKMGLYVIGNFELLSAKSALWGKITSDLRQSGQIGDSLRLYCQNHPEDEGLVIRQPEDFHRAPEGGCLRPCAFRLNCGHVCMRVCHPYDREHNEYKCTKKCERKLPCGHACRKQCQEKCGGCQELVRKKVPRCGHEQWMLCHLDPQDFVCQEDCRADLSCGHRCGDRCGERHQCYEKIQHKWACGHTAEIYCREKDKLSCTAPCQTQLACGHPCVGDCTKCHNGRLHQKCRKGCNKILVCGHECKDTCSYCPPCQNKCENRCVHSACENKCGLLCVPCMEPCAWQCPHHRCRKRCSQPCDRPQCNEPCPKLLKCDHPCIGLCGEPCPTKCRECDKDEVTAIFFGTEDDPEARFVQLQDCKHVLEVTALDRWMTATTDDKEDSVQLKACPICKTVIRRNLRYGTVINAMLSFIETVKGRMLGDEERRREVEAKLEKVVEVEQDPVTLALKEGLLVSADRATLGGLFAVDNQIALLDETKKLVSAAKKKLISSRSFDAAIKKFESWICQHRLIFSQQESDDAQRETLRLKHLLMLLNYGRLIASRGAVDIPTPVQTSLKRHIRELKLGAPYPPDRQRQVESLLKELDRLVPESGLGISEAEKQMIVKTMGLSQGHWFKCPKGHVYCIADCGGAVMESRCPECKSPIGGTSYRLREGNALATEMDGAVQPSWPTMLG